MGGAYPALMAMGAAFGEKWLGSLPRWGRRTVVTAFFIGVAVCGMYVCALVLPIAASGPLRDFALEHNGDLRERRSAGTNWCTLSPKSGKPAARRAHEGWRVGGQLRGAGCRRDFGPAYNLPRPISGTNSAWLRRYPDPPPSTLIVLGFSHDQANRTFTSCRLAGHNTNSLGVKNEESQDHPDIFVCGPPRLPWPEFWKRFRRFG